MVKENQITDEQKSSVASARCKVATYCINRAHVEALVLRLYPIIPISCVYRKEFKESKILYCPICVSSREETEISRGDREGRKKTVREYNIT
jgi:hypothetical protein